MDSPMYEQPTEPQDYINSIPGEGPAPGVPTTPLQAPGLLASPAVAPSPAHSNSAHVPSRRRFMGKSIGTLAALGSTGVAAAIGGVALEQWIQHGGLSNLFHHGSMANDAQIGHLLRRSGFGVSHDELAQYRGLSFNGAVDQLLNYQQVSDDDMRGRSAHCWRK
ncbi:MAG: hypothetical protein E6I93_06355 [Chloroflexi bacterium]|nr:MAG: hypothetical protein E6I93_06355 [Chloroflexota bacterium]